MQLPQNQPKSYGPVTATCGKCCRLRLMEPRTPEMSQNSWKFTRSFFLLKIKKYQNLAISILFLLTVAWFYLIFQRISFDFKGFCDFLDLQYPLWNQRKSFENQVKSWKNWKISRVQTFTQQLWCLYIMPSVWDHFPRGFSGTWCWHSPGKGPPLRFMEPGDSYWRMCQSIRCYRKAAQS